MCRLFGFRSVIQSKVHTSLISADNALMLQGQRHPDGWGVAYYNAGAPHIVKSASSALKSTLFQKVSGLVASQTVLAHLRKATLGDLSIVNTHPFQYGRWVFAHNGNIEHYATHRTGLINRVSPELRRFILGETDSEIIFFILLTKLASKVSLEESSVPITDLVAAVKECVKEITSLVGDFHCNDSGPQHLTYLTFLLTNGNEMIAFHGGKDLYFSTYKRQCSERDTCPSFAFECEHPSKSGSINHLIVSSEPLSGENIWLPLKPGGLVASCGSMQIYEDSL